jgi:SAM-dependent methyltransferase
MTRTIARQLARSFFLSKGKQIFEQNVQNWNLPLTKFDKLLAGIYIILEDYSRGQFPPKFEDQAKAYAAEVAYRETIPGLDLATIRRTELKKPFWFGRSTENYLKRFIRLIRLLEQINVAPPSRLLELGCGTGWMAEFLAITGFDVTGTSISPRDIEDARGRLNSIATKGLIVQLRFEIAAMESIADTIGPKNHYDAVFVFEALHHAFDWRRAIQSSFECLRPGGWLLICSEPNLLHTFTSYRVAKLSNTHEIGFSRKELTQHLFSVGCSSVKYVSSSFHFWIGGHWIVAQKPL